MKKPLHIVIEGTDGSGKATQVKYLTERFEKEIGEGSAFKIDFPRYGTPSCYFVEKYLNGGYGTAEEVGSYAASILYTVDRFDNSALIRQYLSEGRHVVCDRFTSASMGHQAGNISNITERDKYLEWLDYTEFEIMKIPRPDMIIFLYVDPQINKRLMDSREDKDYLKGKKKDILEADMDHLKRASDAFHYVAKKYNWITIDCAPKTPENPEGALLSREEIHDMVWKEVTKKIESM